MDEKKDISINERKYGIDLLRIIAMIMIVIIHIFNHGGLFSNYEISIPNELTGGFIYSIVFCAVNCFGIISGYVGYNSKHKYSNIIYYYFLAVFYLLITNIIWKIRYPEEVGAHVIVLNILPFAYSELWYFSAYFCFFYFIPFINIMMEKLDGRQSTVLVISIFIVFTIIPTFVCRDSFF